MELLIPFTLKHACIQAVMQNMPVFELGEDECDAAEFEH